MQFVKLTQQLALIITAATLLAGPAVARAEGRRSPSSGGAGLTGLTPAAWVKAPAPVVPTGTAPVVPTGAASVVPPGAAPVVPTGAAPVVPTGATAVSPAPPTSVPAPPDPPAAPISPGSAAVPPPVTVPATDPEPTPAADPATAPTPAPAPSPPPAASNTTTQTITQVQVSTCVSHCDGGNQVQQASQDNTTVQAVGPPTPRDGGASIVVPPLPTVRTTSSTPPASTPATATPATGPSSTGSGMSQVQVGCLEHCYGSTTLDTSGMTLAQIEQLLDELQVPTPPVADAAPAGAQHSTQQTATQSESGEGGESQVAGQTNGTTQVVVTPSGAPADGGTGAGTADGGAPAAAVNQTAQGIVQLQVGCIFYCSGTQQTQQAQQSNATVQTVDSSGAGAVNTVSRVVVQVQVGCVAWCYDAVESQTATGSDASVVAVAAPPEVTPPAGTAPVGTTPPPATPVVPAAPSSAKELSASPRSTSARPRDSGGSPVRVPTLALAVATPGTALVPPAAPVVAPAIVRVEVSPRGADHAAHSTHHGRRVPRHHRVFRAAGVAPVTVAGPGPRATAGTSSVESSPELVALLVLAAVGFGVRHWRLVR